LGVLRLLAALGCLLAAAPVRARGAEGRSAPEPAVPAVLDPGREPRPGSLLAGGVALVPGLLIHGSGHFALGERQSACRLLATQGAGLAGVIGGIGLLSAVGASEKLAVLYVPLTVGGLGLFGVSFLADVVGAVHGRRPWPEPVVPPGITVRAGYVGLFGSKHSFRHLGELGVEWRAERLVLDGQATLHPQGDFGEYRCLAGWRLWAPSGDPVTRLSLVAELARQGFHTEGFAVTTVRALGELRWNLGDFLPTMQNAWLLGRLGGGFDSLDFAGTSADDDGLPFLVAELGLGLMATDRVEAELAYRHRKGELPGGMAIGDGMAGFAGMLELRGRVAVGRRWALVPGVRLGTGVMPWLSLESRLF